MNLDLNGYRLHLVFSPTDMRNGYRTLSAIASSCLQLDISEGKDCVMAYTGEPREIEDPWYTDRYDVVYDEVDAGCEALLNELEQERRIKGKHYE